MTAIICLDDDNGMMFNHRRQSQDREVRARVMERAAGQKLWMNAYSYKQFTDCSSEGIIADEGFLEKAGEDDYCFIEDRNIIPYLDRIERIILYKWNRKYPADFYFTVELEGWKQNGRKDFTGYSHEMITEEVYTRL
ncbi:ribonuclease Z [Clostridium sp. MCC353]|uniref:ribonuclease Z n=1 Tax=Clostridium sp. MCC353 TaxID=2592646 RepID=UPI001C0172CC|nr:ribonuclease Z [Clostridium sp. MCC353]MBT9776569.1 ribonuclease Z [Clostridium sp. MCC353]